MQTALSMTVLIVSMLLASIAATGIACLPDLGMPDLDYEAFEDGAVLLLFKTETLWQKYPAPPLLGIIVHDITPVYFALYVGGYYYWCHRRRARPLLVGLACLATAPLPYLIGHPILATSPPFEAVAYWMEAIFTAPFLAATACAIFAALDIRQRFKTRLAPVPEPGLTAPAH